MNAQLPQDFDELTARPVDTAVEDRRRALRARVIWLMATLDTEALSRLVCAAEEIAAE